MSAQVNSRGMTVQTGGQTDERERQTVATGTRPLDGAPAHCQAAKESPRSETNALVARYQPAEW